MTKATKTVRIKMSQIFATLEKDMMSDNPERRIIARELYQRLDHDFPNYTDTDFFETEDRPMTVEEITGLLY